MANIKITGKCPQCGGDGLVATYDSQGQVISETTCPHCNGTGYRTSDLLIDDTLIQDIFDKVKKIKKTVDDIWEKINV